MVTIYALKCEPTKEVYIGCTAGKIGKRMREHRCLLNAGTHKATKLQERWNRYGSAAFRMCVVEQLPDDADVDLKRKRELMWMEAMAVQQLLLNEHMVSYRPINAAIEKGVAAAHQEPGNRWTPEANLKRRLAQLGIPKGHGAKISATKRARRAMR